MYQFNSVDEAVHIIFRDIETKHFNHYYYGDPLQKDREVCQICGNDSKDHQKIEKVKIEELNPNASNNQPSEGLNINSNLKQKDNPIMVEVDITLNNNEGTKSIYDNINKGNNSKRSAKTYSLKNDDQLVISKRSAKTHSVRNEDLLKEIDDCNINIPKPVIFSQEILEMLEDPKLCSICYANNKDSEIVFSCNHKFCHDCIIAYLKIMIANGKVGDLKCLSEGCERLFSDEEIKNFVDCTIYLKYRKFKINQLKLQKNNESNIIVNCPHPDCEEVIEYDSKEEECFVECAIKHKFCVKCKTEGWHRKSECKTVIYSNC